MNRSQYAQIQSTVWHLGTSCNFSVTDQSSPSVSMSVAGPDDRADLRGPAGGGKPAAGEPLLEEPPSAHTGGLLTMATLHATVDAGSLLRKAKPEPRCFQRRSHY